MNDKPTLTPPRMSIHDRILDRVHLLFTLLALGWGIGFFARVSFIAELTTHFRAALFWALLLVVVAYGVLRAWRWVVVSLLIASVVGAPVVAWYLPRSHDGYDSDSRNLRILQFNVLTTNTHRGRLISLVAQEDPDILILQEINQPWVNALEALSEGYPHTYIYPRNDNFGMGLYSKLPLHNARMSYATRGVPGILAEIKVNGRTIRLFNFHALPPVSRRALAARNTQLAAFKPFVESQSDLVIVVGDMNTAMWSPFYTDAIREAGLINSRQGFGTVPTWPAWFPLLSIPLDHCLLSPEIRVLDTRAGPNIGSDHYPMIIDIYVPPSGRQSNE